MNLLCKLGIHDRNRDHTVRHKKDPRGNDIVIEDRDIFYCSRCGKVFFDFHYKDWEFRPEAWENGKLK